jgi:hypothetical protein
MGEKRRRFKITAEVTVEVTDEAALKRTAAGQIENLEFTAGPGRNTSKVRADALAEVHCDAAAALDWVVDPDAIVSADEALQLVRSVQTIVEVDHDGNEHRSEPDFAALFSLCRCGRDDCDECSGFQLTPRTTLALWTVAQVISDQAYDDIEEYGDDPVTDDADWNTFDEYPRITWQQDAVWRRQAARSFDDLTGDLEAGNWPSPTCPAEEMALHLMLQMAQAAVADGWGPDPDKLAGLPEHPDDFDWNMALEVLFQDHDILEMFDERRDGIEDPDSTENRAQGIGDYRPKAWFRPFLNAIPRDGRRGFRR